MASDDLLEMRTHFFIGNYQSAINDADALMGGGEELQARKKLLLYRCYLSQGNYSVVIDEIGSSAPPELRTVKLLAAYFEDPASEDAARALREDLGSPCTSEIAMDFRGIAGALFYLSEGNYEDALRSAVQCTWLEGKSLASQIYLHLNRPDLALKEVAQMSQIDEDSVVTQLSQAWVYCALGGEKAVQASYIFDELIDKHGTTALLLCGQAVSKMAQGHFPEAEPLLLSALEKAPNDRDTLINLTVCYRHLNKPAETIGRKMKQIQMMGGAAHSWLSDLDYQEKNFDKAAARYQVNAI